MRSLFDSTLAHSTRARSTGAATLGLVALVAIAGACHGGGGDTTDVVFSGASSDGGSGGEGSTGSSTSTGDASTSGASDGVTSSTSTTSATDTSSGSTMGDTSTGAAGECTPGATQPCYSGPPGTEGVGACAVGSQTCDDEGSWGGCEGDVVPVTEVCGNKVDDDCNGMTDDDVDADGDGWTTCGGDCCDVAGGVCQKPELVNPGAYEYPGNEVDDDCDGEIDEAAATCDGGLASDSANPLDYAKAMDLCQFTVEKPADPTDKIWGVISAKLTLADGKGAPVAVQRAIRPNFGNSIAKQAGDRMALFSSGHAAAKSDTKPDYAGFQSGVDLKTTSAAPADWLTANGGKLPNPPGCLAPGQLTANDPIMLTLRVRAPTNAKSFSVKMFFFSAEYPEWVCSQYNDFFVALLDSAAVGNPKDKNIAIYNDGKQNWPVGVNLVKVADGLFTACQDGIVGCQGSGIPEANYTGCVSATPLVGTGFDELDGGGCGSGKFVGGGTGWLTMDGNVAPGEVFELRLAIWDSGGHIFDSLVLLDDWQWSIDPAEPGLEPQ
ncbi:MAG: choice-of-anchor L domain-containing protein [Myxococcales bacterium]|nr:choice-of-anchor L domain-containing protein [Myxococcales bacterium]